MTMLVDSVTVDQFMKKDPTWDRLVRSSTQGTNIYRDYTVEKWRYNPRRRINRARCEQAYEHGLAGPYPRHIVIEPTNYCNASCFFCSRQKLSRPLGYMAWDTYTKIIDEAVAWGDTFQPQFYSVSLYMLGEPMLHPRIRDMVTYAKRMGVPYVDLSTNGLLPFDSLLGTGLDEIIVSLDGIDQISYGINRGGDYRTVVDNLDFFLKKKVWGHYDGPLVRLQIIDMETNKSYIDDFIREWIDQVDVVYLKHLEGMVQALGNNLVSEDNRIEINRNRKKCKQLYYTQSVNWDGTVAYCCHDPEGKSIIGKVDDGLQKLWQDNIRIREARNHQEHDHYEGICENCVDWAHW